MQASEDTKEDRLAGGFDVGDLAVLLGGVLKGVVIGEAGMPALVAMGRDIWFHKRMATDM